MARGCAVQLKSFRGFTPLPMQKTRSRKLASRCMAGAGRAVTQTMSLLDPPPLVDMADAAGSPIDSLWEGTSNLVFTLAAAAAVTEAAADVGEDGDVTKYTGMFAVIADSLQEVLIQIQDKLAAAGVPYSFGWSIITITVLIKIVTYPLTKLTVESGMNQQNLAPKIKAIKERYGEDKEKINELTNKLYAEYEVNPLAGCLPSLATIPVFIGLYRSLSNIANEGLLDDASFYWIPNLAGPTDVNSRGIGWLTDLDANGVPPLGWHDTIAYLALPVLLVGLQFVSQELITPKPTDEDQKPPVMLKFLPLFIGWIAINLPSGLALYYFMNTLTTTLQQVYLRKLGGANLTVKDIQEFQQKPGTARRTGSPILYMDEALVQLDGEASGIVGATETVEVDALDGCPPQLRQTLEVFAEDTELRVIYDDVMENGWGEEVLKPYYESKEWTQKINDKLLERAWTSGSMGNTVLPSQKKENWDRPVVRRSKRMVRKVVEIPEEVMKMGREDKLDAPVSAPVTPGVNLLKQAEGLTL